jgi:glucose-6-phosphate isomerase
MKLRRNKLEPLRFDIGGALLESCGLSLVDVDRTIAELAWVRDRVLGGNPGGPSRTRVDGDYLAETDAAYFFARPRLLLAEYEAKRMHSELGRIFQAANRLHAACDRVVVLGSGLAYHGGRALMESCCQPFWNELTRGERGSKPRLYFAGNDFDNDTTQGLLYWLGTLRDSNSDSEFSRWGLIVIDQGRDDWETTSLLLPFLQALRESGGRRSEGMADRLLPVTRRGSLLGQALQGLDVRDIFVLPDAPGERYSILEVGGLLTAAVLGINVIELLQGAEAMNQHFAAAAGRQNLILQFVAINHLLQKRGGIDRRVLSVWSQALERVGMWYDRLVADGSAGIPTMTMVVPRDLPSRERTGATGAGRYPTRLYHQLLVDECRFDPLTIASPPAGDAILKGSRENQLPGLMQAAIEHTQQVWNVMHQPSTKLFLPRVDELHLGQLFQMLMLATWIEEHSADSSRPDHPSCPDHPS